MKKKSKNRLKNLAKIEEKVEKMKKNQGKTGEKEK